MIRLYEQILKKLEVDLEQIEVETKDILHRAEQGIKITKQVLAKIAV